MTIDIDWSKQHCGIHQGSWDQVALYMPDVALLIAYTFPENENLKHFTWDIKVHMLMPNQYPCIPNWHYDNVPKVDGKQDFSKVQLDKPVYLWVSGAPLTEFRKNGKTWFIEPETWTRITQEDEHRGTVSTEFCWRGFIRATHRDILKPKDDQWNSDCVRRHSQVYLDSNNFKW